MCYLTCIGLGSFHMYGILDMLYLFEVSNSSAPNVAAQQSYIVVQFFFLLTSALIGVTILGH
jgi:hypothetical protein